MRVQLGSRLLGALLLGFLTVATARAQLAQEPQWMTIPKANAARQPTAAPTAPPPLLAPQLKPRPKPQQNLPRSNSAYWSPRSTNLNAPADYYLRSMGPHVQLTPAMRYHLARSRQAPTPLASSATVPRTASATAPGQGAGIFYPGISRAPREKPFTNAQRAGGLQEYWPLLLEGRQDPNTGLIIWTLP